MKQGILKVVAISTAVFSLSHFAKAAQTGVVTSWGEQVMPLMQPGARFKAIAAGGNFNLALNADGTVLAWGDNVQLQCLVPSGTSNIVSIAAGHWHTLALKADGTVTAWWNLSFYGQTSVPGDLTNVAAIAAGGYHSLALKADGSVVGWGRNDYGQSTVPDGLSNVVAVAGGMYHSLALKSDGTVAAWGLNDHGQSTVPVGLSNVVALAGEWLRSVALKSDGTVVAWGNPDSVPAGLSNVVDIAGGGDHTLALLSDGTVVAWGQNDQGQCTVPDGLNNVVAVAAGDYHSLALRSDGTLVVWGGNASGQSILPGSLTNIVSLSAQWSHNVALTAGGTVVAWGRDSTDFGQNIVPIGLSNVVAVAAGSVSSLALKSDGTCVIWGYGTLPASLSNVLAIAPNLALISNGTVVVLNRNNSYGELDVPSDLTNAIAVSTGFLHEFALRSDGTVTAWGSNLYGQGAVPMALNDVIGIAAGDSHNLALKSDGTVVAWGRNGNGQSTVPAGLSNVVALAGGGSHSLALTSDGMVVAWGANSGRQCVVPTGVTNVMGIAAGFAHSLALVATAPLEDTFAPALTVTSHSNNAAANTSMITLAGTASDAGRGNNGIVSVTVNSIRADADTAAGGDPANWSRTVNLVPGANAITVVATDGATNSVTRVINIVLDTTAPALSVAAPVPGQRTSNAVFAVSGTASDDRSLAAVRVQVNGDPWSTAGSVDGWSNWTANVSLAPGANVIRAYALDAAGNISTTNSVAAFFVVTAPLTLQITGRGTVVPDYSGQRLEIGASYTMTARPAFGYAFSNWTGSVIAGTPTLQFVMQSNVLLQADFVPDTSVPAAADFAGLFYDTNSSSITVSNAGAVAFRVMRSGAFTGTLRLGATRAAFSGQFSPAGEWLTSQVKTAPPGFAVWLRLAEDEIAGQISNATWTAQLTANRAVYSRTRPAPQAGQYTLVLPGSAEPQELPAGHGALAVNVSPSGTVKVTGTLGDGTALSGQTFVSGNGQWPLYSALYSKKGIIIGWLTFRNNTVTMTDLDGVVGWIKPGQSATRIYPNGFDWPYESEPNAFGSSFTNRMPLLNWTNGLALLENGNLSQNFTNGLMLAAAKASGTNGLKLTITTSGARAGLFKGVIGTPATGAFIAVKGALLQRQDLGYGSFIGTNQSGSLLLRSTE